MARPVKNQPAADEAAARLADQPPPAADSAATPAAPPEPALPDAAAALHRLAAMKRDPVAIKRLFETGALDVFVASILMKKSRPAHKLTVIGQLATADALARVLLRESSTAGVRLRTESRWKLKYEFKTVQTEFGEIKIKFYFGGDIRKFSPEYEDVVSAAMKAKAPFVKVYNAAVMAANLIKEN